jgi:hypothetical protein
MRPGSERSPSRWIRLAITTQRAGRRARINAAAWGPYDPRLETSGAPCPPYRPRRRRGLDPTHRRPRDPRPGRRHRRPGDRDPRRSRSARSAADQPRRSRSARSAADQPGVQRRRGRGRDRRRRADRLANRRHRRGGTVEDGGPGIPDTANLFVPFFTTKPTGSGIGLVLAGQIAEAHRGSLTVGNRASERGAQAVITLPRSAPVDGPG